MLRSDYFHGSFFKIIVYLFPKRMLIDDDSLLSVIQIFVNEFLFFGHLGPIDSLVDLCSKSVISSLDLHFQIRIFGLLGHIDIL